MLAFAALWTAHWNDVCMPATEHSGLTFWHQAPQCRYEARLKRIFQSKIEASEFLARCQDCATPGSANAPVCCDHKKLFETHE